jgi:hypothetical protein
MEMRKLGEGQESVVYAMGDGRVAKLFKGPRGAAMAAREMSRLVSARASGADAPEPFGAIEYEGRHGYVMGRIDGPSLLALVEENPLRAPRLARLFGCCHASLMDHRASPDLPQVKDGLRKDIEGLPGDRLGEDRKAFLLGLLEGLPDGDALLHGDFNPSNLILTEQGPVAIDWSGAARGDPMADLAHTLLILENGQLPPDTSTLMRPVLRAGGQAFARSYLGAYRKARPIDRADRADREALTAWTAVRAGGRLAYGGACERPVLLRIIDRAYAAAGGRARKASSTN